MNSLFKVGKYYRSTLGTTIHVLARVHSQFYGECFIAENNDKRLFVLTLTASAKDWEVSNAPFPQVESKPVDLVFDKRPVQRCVLCKKERGQHKAKTFECPTGTKTRIGYTNFGPEVYTESRRTNKGK